MNKKLKILYCGLKFDYGSPSNGYSFEHYNFYNTFTNMANVELVDYVPMDELIVNNSQNYLNDEIINLSKKKKYDLVFFFMFKDEIYINTLNYLKNELSIPTVAWMADDHWRFDTYSKYIAKYFSYVVTTDEASIPKYVKNGITNIILSQWACNHFHYKPNIQKLLYNVSFVGMYYGTRGKDIDYLSKNIEDIHCWGQNWKKGKLSLEDKIKVYSNSLISLNFSKSSQQKNLKNLAKIFLNKNSNGNIKINNFKEIIDKGKNFFKKSENQIKARVFEVPGCKGFLLSEKCKNIENYFEIDKEIVLFDNIDEANDKIKFYLKNKQKAFDIASNGYERVLREHTYEKRFNNIFKKIYDK